MIKQWPLFFLLLAFLAAEISEALPVVFAPACLFRVAGKAKGNSGSQENIDAIVATYRGILEDSLSSIEISSIQRALSEGNPFALDGKDALFIQTQDALAALEEFNESQGPTAAAEARKRLLSCLSDFGPKKTDRRRRAHESRVRETGVSPPLSKVYELPESILVAGGAGIYSPDGKYLVTIAHDGGMRAYHASRRERTVAYSKPPLDSGNRPWGFQGTNNRISAELHPDGNSFAFILPRSQEAPGPFVIDFRTGDTLKSFLDGRGRGRNLPSMISATRVHFSRNGEWLGMLGKGAGDYHSPEAVWNLTTGFVPVGQMMRFYSNDSQDFSHDGRYWFSTAGHSLHIYDLKMGFELLDPLPQGEDEEDRDNRRRGIESSDTLAVHPSKPVLAVQDGRKILLFEYTDFDRRYTSKEMQLTASSGGSDFGRRPARYIDGPLKMKTFFPNTSKKEWDGMGLLWSPDGRFLVNHHVKQQWDRVQLGKTPYPESSLFIIDAQNLGKAGKIYRDLSPHITWEIQKMRFSPDGNYLLTLDFVGRLTIFSVPDFEPIASAGDDANRIWDFEISPDMRRIFTVEGTGVARERNFIAP